MKNCDCPARIRRVCTGCPDVCAGFNGFKQYQVIKASAGTGKTYRLAMRFIQLLCFGVDPSEILAVTFTRKAAGEIFDKIIRLLMEKAESASGGCPRFSPETFLDILRRLLASRKNLQIGTIDSFFLQVLESCAPELGIWGKLSIIDDGDDRLHRRVMRSWLRRIDSQQSRDTLRELLKAANEERQKSFSETMKDLLKKVYPLYLLYPENEKWGRNFWDHPLSRDLLDENEWESRAGELRAFLAVHDPDGTDRSFQHLRTLAAFAAKGSCAGRVEDIKKTVEYWTDKKNSPDWIDRTDGMEFFNRKTLSAENAECVRKILRHVRALCYFKALNRGRAVRELLDRYDQIYDREVRNAGYFTFDDVALALQPRDNGGDFKLFADENVNLEERLDARLNHYLFDEFQDTSDIQWRAFSGLFEELCSGERDVFRSFFCVGDVKQAIYRFRHGNPRLLQQLIDRLTLRERLGIRSDASPEDVLSESYRSAPAVLDFVNAVFAGPRSGCGFLAAVPRMEYPLHTSAEKLKTASGFAVMLDHAKAPDDEIAFRAQTVLEILREISPFERGLTVGILFRKNSTMHKFSDALKELCSRNGWRFPVSTEGGLDPRESMAVMLFEELLVLASHPQDASAAAFLFNTVFDREKLDDPRKWMEKLDLSGATLSSALRESILHGGVADLAARFTGAFGGEWNDFDRVRMQALYDLARDFDGTPDEFRELLQWKKCAQRSVGNTIQLMTIHKSKGLDFDVVFLPDLDAVERESDYLPKIDVPESREADAAPRWINYSPDGGMADVIPVWRDFKRREKEERQLDVACYVYVAMTRAKRGLYLLGHGGKDAHHAFAAIRSALHAAEKIPLPGLETWTASRNRPLPEESAWEAVYATGDCRYYEDAPKKTAPPPPEMPDVRDVEITGGVAATVAPSRMHAAFEAGENRFDAPRGAATGTEIHALFEALDFMDDAFDAEAFLAARRPSPESARIFRAALAFPEIRNALQKIPGAAELWKEQDFLVRLDGKIFSGTFDRVVVLRDEKKNVVGAAIFDYKSDQLPDERAFLERHAAQLKLYRRAAAQMLHLDESAVPATILALRLGRAIPVP